MPSFPIPCLSTLRCLISEIIVAADGTHKQALGPNCSERPANQCAESRSTPTPRLGFTDYSLVSIRSTKMTTVVQLTANCQNPDCLTRRVRLKTCQVPTPGRFLLTPSFHSQKTSRYFAGNYPLRAHNGIVIETFISANVRRAHANLPTPSATHRAAKSNGNEPLQRSSIKSNLWRQPLRQAEEKKTFTLRDGIIGVRESHPCR